MGRLKYWTLFFLVVLWGACTSCAGEQEVQKPIRVTAEPVGTLTPGTTQEVTYSNAATMDGAIECILQTLRDAGKRFYCIVRDGVEHKKGEIYSMKWLYIYTQDHEWLDVFLTENPEDLAAIRDVYPFYPRMFRSNEAFTKTNELGVPHDDQYYLPYSGFVVTNTKGGFLMYFDGYPFLCCDLGCPNGSRVYWDQTNRDFYRRPSPTIKADAAPLPDFPVNYPKASIQESVDFVRSQLDRTRMGYSWEIQDSITIDAVKYPVTWMYAKNREGEWVDLVWSKDPDFAYFLYNRRELFADLRRVEAEAMQAKLPEDMPFIAQFQTIDAFYYGYSLYVEGVALSILDCGFQGIASGYDASIDEDAWLMYFSRDEWLSEEQKH